MIKRISFRSAINITLLLLVLVTVFHTLVLLNVIPYSVTWGGKLRDLSQMRIMEVLSLVVNSLLMVVVLIKARMLKLSISDKIITFILWLFVALFTLNTLGNIFSDSLFEQMVFTPLTLVLALLCKRIVQE